ncbi:MAG: FtsX-like permease family protein [Deltaproteobacteria bacterium]|nr:MAG: FtsX-like permease family protein [Deltaproteobacteria bacterium]
MRGFLADLRHGVRSFARDPGFTAIAVLALAIGVGSSTAIFSIVDTALLRPLPYSAPDRLIQLVSVDGAGQRAPMGAVEFFELEKRAKTVEAIAALYPSWYTVASPSGVRTVRTASVSASIFATLGIFPSRGRAFEPAEDLAGREQVAIVSDAFWRRDLGADPAVLGRVIQIQHVPVVIVGVLPAGAVFPRAEKAELFFPLDIRPEQALPAARNGLYGFARLRPHVSAATARAEIDSIVRATSGYGIAVEPLQRSLTGDAAPALKAAFAAVVLLLLIACANVASLLLMRGTARGRDLAIRAALGGGRNRIALQHVMEGLLLAIAGGAVGLVLAVFAVQGVVALAPAGIPRLHELHVDWRMGAFALIASLLSGALAGAASAWQSLHANLFLVLKDGGIGTTSSGIRSRVRDSLVVAQLALALLLATGTGLLLRSLQRFSAVPLGLEPKNVMAGFAYPQRESSPPLMAELLAAARTIPGIENAALVGNLPMDALRGGGGWDDRVHVEGRHPSPTQPDLAAINWYSPGYLATAGIRLLRGRDLATSDVATSAPVAVVNETFASRYLSGRDPIGALFTSTDWGPITFAVVGVIQDVRQWGPAYGSLPEVYLPLGQFGRYEALRGEGAMLVVKSGLPSGEVEAALRAATTPLSSQLSLGAMRPLDEYFGSYFAERRFQRDLAAAFAFAALCLAAVGVYGSMAFSVVQRRRELAVRAALGAQQKHLASLVLLRGARLTLLGISLGLLGSLAFSRFLSALLYGIGVRDPLTFAVVAVALAIVSLAASALPARAAARLDPMTVLRSE